MITPLVSFGHCIVCRSFYGAWLPLWYRLAIVLSVGRFTVYDYPFGILWPLYCLSVALRCMITPLVSFGHCIMSVVLRCMITPVVSFGHCIVCRAFYGVWIPLWYLLAIVLSVGRFTVYDYLFGIVWPLYCLSVVLRCMITHLVSFGHCIVCRSFYGVLLPLWYLLAIVLSVVRFTVHDYPFGIFWPLYCLSVVLRWMITPLVYFAHCIVSAVLRCMITPLVSYGHCIVCRSFYGAWLWYPLAIVLSVGVLVWLPLWYLLAIVLSVGRFTVYDYPFGIVWPLYCLSVILRYMITHLVSFGHCIVCRSFYGVWLPLWYRLATVLSVGRFTVYDYPFGIFWPLYCLSVVLRCMITSLVSFGHCIVCRSFYGVWLPLWYILPIVLCRSFYGVWLPLWYRVAIVLSVGRFTVYDYPFGILWPLCCLSVVLRWMITPLVYFGHSIVSVVLRCMITPLVSCGHCIVCRSFYGVCYPFGILWPLCCLSVRCFTLVAMITRFGMITPLAFGHCIVCRSFYGVWLPLWYRLATVLSVGRFTVYDYPFGIFWPLYCLSVVLRCMITSLVSFGHCIVCRSLYGVWLPLWYLLAIVLSVGRFTVYDYPFGMVWPLYCLSSFYGDYLFGMITPFGLPLWYLLAIVLSVGRFTVYDYPFGIFWPLYCLSVVLRCMITPLVSFGHCIVCRSFYGVWLPL